DRGLLGNLRERVPVIAGRADDLHARGFTDPTQRRWIAAPERRTQIRDGGKAEVLRGAEILDHRRDLGLADLVGRAFLRREIDLQMLVREDAPFDLLDVASDGSDHDSLKGSPQTRRR